LISFIQFAAQTSENRTYVFKANSADDLKNWVDAIKKTKKTEIMIKNLENKISSLNAQNSNMMKQFQLEIKLLIEQVVFSYVIIIIIEYRHMW